MHPRDKAGLTHTPDSLGGSSPFIRSLPQAQIKGNESHGEMQTVRVF